MVPTVLSWERVGSSSGHVSELRWVLMVVEVLEHVDGVVGFGECGRERMRKLVAIKGEALVGTGMASLVAWKLD